MNNKHGFTLVEMLVAIAIFSIVVAIGVGGFVHALRTQREISALIATETNASTALEQMAREIRTGELFCADPGSSWGTPELNSVCNPNAQGLGTGCTPSGNSNDPVWTCNSILDFYNADYNNIDYELKNGVLGRSQDGINGQFTPLTSNNVDVVSTTFIIFGNTEGDNWPPRITIVLRMVPSSTDPTLESNVLDFQTTVSAREIDCTQGTSNVEC
jgi:prepilin-type N-terminal cleavage/methylation domain-containing protein